MIGLTLRQMEYLVAVADTGTIAGAADLCKVSPVAVGQAIDEIEKSLHTVLTVRRRSKGVALTQAGEAVVAHLRKILRETQQIPQIVESANHRIERSIKIGIFPTLAPWIMPAILREYAQNFPEVSVDFVELTAAQMKEKLTLGTVDVALTYKGHDPQNTAVLDAGELTLYALVPASHKLAQRASVTLDELRQEKFAIPGYMPAHDTIYNLLERHSMEQQVAWTAQSNDTLKSLVGEELAISLVFSFGRITHSLHGQQIVSVPIEQPGIENSVVVCYPPHRSPGVIEKNIQKIVQAEASGHNKNRER